MCQLLFYDVTICPGRGEMSFGNEFLDFSFRPFKNRRGFSCYITVVIERLEDAC